MSEPRRALEPEPKSAVPGWVKPAAAFGLALALLFGVGAAVWLVGGQQLAALVESWKGADYPGPGEAETTVEIPAGTSVRGIADLLVEADVVASSSAFLRVAGQDSRATTIQAGTYRLATRLPAAQALGALLDSANRVTNRFVLREGYRLDQQVAVMAETSQIAAEKFTAKLKDAKALDLPTWAKGDAEGFLFPDSYELGSDPTPDTMIAAVVDRFTSVTTELDFAAKAKALGVTPYQALIVASIIEKEVFLAEDRPKVARVVYNRLEQGMKLGMDSTAIYASWAADLEQTNYNLDSPYNTRVNTGLPPGPIGSPGEAALAAAVNPAAGDWLYFVTVDLNTGVTEFSSDEAGFVKSREKFRAWCAQSEENQALCK